MILVVAICINLNNIWGYPRSKLKANVLTPGSINEESYVFISFLVDTGD